VCYRITDFRYDFDTFVSPYRMRTQDNEMAHSKRVTREPRSGAPELR
jgi:hypothetical protein